MVKKRILLFVALACSTLITASADEGMWLPNLIGRQIDDMKAKGFHLSAEDIYSINQASLKDAVVLFGRGCTGELVSPEGLLFTNHHCGYEYIQSHSSLEHDYLTDGFWAMNRSEELPNPGLTVSFLVCMDDVTDSVLKGVNDKMDEIKRKQKIDANIERVKERALKEYKGQKGYEASVESLYYGNQYFLFIFRKYSDVRLVAAPPSSIGKFGGDTDNWMWPRQTGDFSIFRVYANAENKPAEYDAANKPYHPKYVAEVSMQGYQDKDYAMTIGFPGSTDRYLCSWGVKQRIEDSNKPRIEVRGIKQALWSEAMQASDAVRIKYASKYAGSSNYWKNAIGMNRGLANLDVIARKQAEEKAFADWVAQSQDRVAKYGEVLSLLEKGYTSTSASRNALTYLSEAFANGAEIIRLARMVQSFDAEKSTAEEKQVFLEDRIKAFFKDYEPTLDQKVLAAMLKIVRERVDEDRLPDIYTKIDKKYKGDYEKYAAYLFKKTSLLSEEKIAKIINDPKEYAKISKDPAVELSLSAMMALYSLEQEMSDAEFDIYRGERLYFAGLKEMNPDKALPSDANFTMRMSYGSIGGYRPYDAAWYNYYSTDRGVLEKEDPTSDEFYVQPEILDLFKKRDFGPYANEKGELQLCFLSNNDITGGNSGSPIFDKNARLIGLAFDGNWEAMSGDIAFEPELQRCIGVDIRYVLFMIDKWGKCPRLIDELKLVR